MCAEPSATGYTFVETARNAMIVALRVTFTPCSKRFDMHRNEVSNIYIYHDDENIGSGESPVAVTVIDHMQHFLLMTHSTASSLFLWYRRHGEAGPTFVLY